MKNIYLNELEKHLIEKLNVFYTLLGEDFYLLKKNKDLILHYAYKKGFVEKVIINIEKNTDWKKITYFYQKQNLFFKKTTLIVNFIIKKLNIILIDNINEISSLSHLDILIILKFNHLSLFVQNSQLLYKLKHFSKIVSCFTPYNLYFINWIKYEIKEKNITIEERAFFLLCKYYEGNTLFIYNILDILSITWPGTEITTERIKKIIIDFFDFYPSHWINSIFDSKIKKAIYILNIFFKQKYNVLILIRSLQKDLLILIYIKREKNININIFLKKNNIFKARYKYFINASKRISSNTLLKAIKILVKIEINIKKKYNNNSVWNQLQELTLILS